MEETVHITITAHAPLSGRENSVRQVLRRYITSKHPDIMES